MGIRRSDLQPLVVSASFDRPSESPIVTYASGDLVANSTTLANVAPLTFGFPEDTTPGNATAKADKSLALLIQRNHSATRGIYAHGYYVPFVPKSTV